LSHLDDFEFNRDPSCRRNSTNELGTSAEFDIIVAEIGM